MQCKFEDVESKAVLEVDLSLNQDGNMSESETKKKKRRVKSVKVK